jgi:hypothetical protein
MTQKKSHQVDALFREKIAIMAKCAGLNLAPEHFDQLCDAWKNVEQMIARIPHERQRLDQPAHTFVNPRIAVHV